MKRPRYHTNVTLLTSLTQSTLHTLVCRTGAPSVSADVAAVTTSYSATRRAPFAHPAVGAHRVCLAGSPSSTVRACAGAPSFLPSSATDANHD